MVRSYVDQGILLENSESGFQKMWIVKKVRKVEVVDMEEGEDTACNLTD